MCIIRNDSKFWFFDQLALVYLIKGKALAVFPWLGINVYTLRICCIVSEIL